MGWLIVTPAHMDMGATYWHMYVWIKIIVREVSIRLILHN